MAHGTYHRIIVTETITRETVYTVADKAPEDVEHDAEVYHKMLRDGDCKPHELYGVRVDIYEHVDDEEWSSAERVGADYYR